MPKPPIVSAVPATDTKPVARSITVKRLARLRLNWFVVGSACGIGMSFFMSMLITTALAPTYRSAMGVGESSETLASAAPVSATPKAMIPTIAPRVPVADTRMEKIGDNTAVKELAMKLPAAASASLTPAPAAKEVAAAKTEIKALTNRRYAVIKTSLFQGGATAGIPFGMMQDIVKAYSYDVDFQRDIHPGDSIEVLLGEAPKASTIKMVEKGSRKNQVAVVQTKKPSQTLRYVALTLQGKKHEIFRVNVDGNYAWYDASGKSIKKSLLATPINAAHITSGFGMREHPVLGYTRFHRGVDFGASTGTPIMAAGDGTVEFKGWKNGYGNFVLIKHNQTYETAYGHISKFGKIALGGRVHQGQVIAYVGMTGMATGPHLHYEVRVNGDQVNPVAKQFNMASGLTGKQLGQFKAVQTSIRSELAGLGGAPAKATASAKPAKLASR